RLRQKATRVARPQIERVEPLPCALDTDGVGGAPSSSLQSRHDRLHQKGRLTTTCEPPEGPLHVPGRRIHENAGLRGALVGDLTVDALAQRGRCVAALEGQLSN